MFKNAAPKAGKTQAVDEQQADALLDALLDDVKGPTAKALTPGNRFARPAPAPAAAPAAPVARHLPAVAPSAVPAPSPAPRVALVTKGSGAAGSHKRPLAAVAALRPKAQAKEVAPASSPMAVDADEDDGAGMGDGGYHEVAEAVPVIAPKQEEATEAEPAPKKAKTEEPKAAPANPRPEPVAAAVEGQEGQMADGWAEILAANGPVNDLNAESGPVLASDQTLPLNAQGLLPFFFLDALEDPASPGTVYLFGKAMLKPGQFVSCCVAVRGMYRSVFVVPSPGTFEDDAEEIRSLERRMAEAPEDKSRRLDLVKFLNGCIRPLKQELHEVLESHNVSKYGLMPVKRSYAFEDATIPHGEQWVLKLRYQVLNPETGKAQGTLPLGLKGDYFVGCLGANQSPLEALLLKRGIMGPCWLALRGAQRVDAAKQVSHCKLEVVVASPKDVFARPATPEARSVANLPTPPLSVAALHIKTHVNQQTKGNEIVAASLVYLSGVSADGPTSKSEWSSPQRLKHMTVVTKLEGKPFPPGFEAQAAKGGSISCQHSERALLSYLMAKIQLLDADVLVGHNIGGYDLDVLLHRMQVRCQCRVEGTPTWGAQPRSCPPAGPFGAHPLPLPCCPGAHPLPLHAPCLAGHFSGFGMAGDSVPMPCTSHVQVHKVASWSRIGRMKRTKFPSLSGGGNVYGGGASAGVMSCIAGRLLCDTYLTARELVHEARAEPRATAPCCAALLTARPPARTCRWTTRSRRWPGSSLASTGPRCPRRTSRRSSRPPRTSPSSCSRPRRTPTCPWPSCSTCLSCRSPCN